MSGFNQDLTRGGGSKKKVEKTGERLEFLSQLESLIRERKIEPVPGSYTNQLLEQGLPAIVRKVGEEAVEVMTSTLESRDRTVSEAADLIYHLLVLLVDQDLSLEEVVRELEARHQGHNSFSS